MKKVLLSIFAFILLFSLASCGDDGKTIVVGATPSPHAEILNSEAVQNYIKSKGYSLEVKNIPLLEDMPLVGDENRPNSVKWLACRRTNN